MAEPGPRAYSNGLPAPADSQPDGPAAVAVDSVSGTAAWSRLHPLSPVLRGSRAIAVLVVILGQRRIGSGGSPPVWVDFVVLGLGIVAAVVAWLVTRWRVEGGDLRIETGLLRRRSQRVPLTRLQAIDIVRPLLGRFLGLAELRLELAGQGRGTSRLSYLAEGKALAVRARLLALAHGIDEQTPEPPERPLLEVPFGRLLGASLLGPATLLLFCWLVSLAVLALVAPAALPVVAASLIPLVIPLGSFVWQRINGEFAFTVAEAPDGLRLRAGLLGTRASTIPRGRVQGIRMIEPLLWRPFGWCRLEVDVARQRDSQEGGNQGRRREALLPVGHPDQARMLLARVLPGVPLEPPKPAAVRPPTRARWKSPLQWRLLGVWSDDWYAVTTTGRLRRVSALVPLDKVQSLRRVQGPVQRRLRLATIHLDTAGRDVAAKAVDRDAADAELLLADLAGRCRRARQATTIR